MFSKHIAASILMASVAITPASQVAAGSSDIVGGIIGGIIGGAIVNGSRRTTRPRTTRRTRRTGVSSAVRAQNREVQTSLNYFGFPAGSPDGVLGRKSRTAVSSYQAFMGYGVTGKLSTHGRDFLLNAFHRAQAGGFTTQQLINENGQGTQGLLVAYRNELTGGQNMASGGAQGGSLGGLPTEVSKSVHEIAKSSDPTAMQLIQRAGFVQLADMNADGRTDYILDTSVTGSTFWCSSTACAVRVFLSTPNGYQRNDFQAFNVTPAMFSCQGATCLKTGAPATQLAVTPTAPQPQTFAPTVQVSAPAASTAAPALPNFMATTAAQPSLASHCSQVSLLTSSNGGFVTQATMSDPGFTLSEQFCLARTYAIAHGEDLASRVQGVTMAQLEAQCAAFGPAMKGYVDSLSVKSHADVLQDVSGFILTTGMSPEQLTGTAKICLSVGYRTDNLDVALGSALLMTALGNKAYGELLGHHLSQGYGADTRPDLALTWYELGFDAIAAGEDAVFAPGDPARNTLIHNAALQANGQGSQNPAQGMAQPATAVLPTFSLGTSTNN